MKKILKILVSFYPFFFFSAANAQPAPILNGIPQAPIKSLTSLAGTPTAPLTIFVKWFINVFWILTVAMVIWAAFMYLTAGGDEEKIKEAKKRLLYAVIAAAIALLATGIDLIAETLLTGKI